MRSRSRAPGRATRSRWASSCDTSGGGHDGRESLDPGSRGGDRGCSGERRAAAPAALLRRARTAPPRRHRHHRPSADPRGHTDREHRRRRARGARSRRRWQRQRHALRAAGRQDGDGRRRRTDRGARRLGRLRAHRRDDRQARHDRLRLPRARRLRGRLPGTPLHRRSRAGELRRWQRPADPLVPALRRVSRNGSVSERGVQRELLQARHRHRHGDQRRDRRRRTHPRDIAPERHGLSLLRRAADGVRRARRLRPHRRDRRVAGRRRSPDA